MIEFLLILIIYEIVDYYFLFHEYPCPKCNSKRKLELTKDGHLRCPDCKYIYYDDEDY